MFHAPMTVRVWTYHQSGSKTDRRLKVYTKKIMAGNVNLNNRGIKPHR